jgi:hypothetical protein
VPAAISAGHMLFLLLQRYANISVHLIPLFFAHYFGKEHLVPFIYIADNRPCFVDAAQIVFGQMHAIHFLAA